MEEKIKSKKYKDATQEEKDRISSIVGFCVGKVLENTLIDTAEKVVKSASDKSSFEQIRRLVANQQLTNGDSPQLQAIYEICTESLNKK